MLASTALLSSCGVRGITGISDDTPSAPADTVSVAETVAESAKEEVEKKEEQEEVRSEFHVGETWTVDGQWSITILGATLTEERNEFSDLAPGAVYIVDYAYSNLGYEDNIMDGLYVSLDQEIIDAGGEKGYIYPGTITNYPESAPVGATCKAQACIGVVNPGTFTINLNMSVYNKDMKDKKAAFVIDPESPNAEVALPSVTLPDEQVFEVGETWVVDGQWAMAVTSVRETPDRNEFEPKNPAAVYIVDYDYKNDGYRDSYGEGTDSSLGGLFVTMDNQIVDSQGMMGYSYAAPVDQQPVMVPVGDSTHAQTCVGVEHAGDFRVTVVMYDSTGKKQKATFHMSTAPQE